MASSLIICITVCVLAAAHIGDSVSVIKVPGKQQRAVSKMLSLSAGTKAVDRQHLECASGPEAWCRDLSSAKTCGALTHCATTVWATQAVNETATCSFCQLFLKDVKKMLQSDVSQQELTSYLLMACSYVKDSAEKYACTDAVKRFLPDILAFLGDEVEPAVVCRAMTLCQKALTFDLCSTCKEYVGDLRKQVQDPATTTEVEQVLNAVCDTLGNQSIVQECKDEVKMIVPMVIKYLVQLLDPVGLCTDLGFCKNGSVATATLTALQRLAQSPGTRASLQRLVGQSPETRASLQRLVAQSSGTAGSGEIRRSKVAGVRRLGDDMCTECKQDIATVQKLLMDPATAKDIEQYLTQLCNLLPDPSIVKECITDVNQYTPQVLQFIAKQLDPLTVCTEIGFCPNQTALTVSDVCSVCDILSALVREEITQEGFKEMVEDVLSKYVCKYFQSPSGCRSAIVVFAPEILDDLAKLMARYNLCDVFGACKASPRMSGSRGGLAPVKPHPKAGPQCALCEFILKEVDQALSDNATEQQIIAALDNVCSVLPSSLSAECKSFVDQYGSAIIKLLVQQADPKKVCTLLGLCTQSVQTAVHIAAGPQCALCEFVLQEIDQLLSQNATEQQIITALDNVCSILPSSLSAECKSFVDQYGPAIIKLLVQQVDPKKVCTLLGLCTQNVHTEVHVAAGPQCALCEFVMQEIDQMLSQNATEQEIITALDKVCSVLPSTVSAECKSYVDQYGPAIIKLLVQQVDPKKVCTLLGLCTQNVQTEGHAAAGPQCALCEFVMQEIDQLLSQNATEQEIIAALDKVCSILPSSLSAECKSFVDQYGPAIIKLLVQQADPKKVCTLLGLCTQNIQTEVHSPAECGFCKMVCKYLEIELRQPKTEQEIEQLLENMCNKLPASTHVQQQCDDFVKKWGKYIVELLKQEMVHPEYICQELKLCP